MAVEVDQEKFYVLSMSDYDGPCGYYRLPPHWYHWLNQPYIQRPPLPADFIDAYKEEYGENADPMREFDTHVFALDANYIGHNLMDVVRAADGKEIIDVEGKFY